MLFQGSLAALEPLLIVTDPWPPYSLVENNRITGIDTEIIQAVFQKMKTPITIESHPWNRCLSLLENRKADAILDASITPERKKFLLFPEEPVSEGITVFFIKKGRVIPYTRLEDMNKFKAGAQLGYSYCDEIDKTPFALKAERVQSLEQNFKKLILGRIDFVIESDVVGYYEAKRLGLSDKIDIIPNAQFCHSGNYLAFAKKSGHEQLATRFSKELKAFKKTKEYRIILEKYKGKTGLK